MVKSGPLSLAPSNPMNRAMISILIFEVIVFGLALPGMILVSQVDSTKAIIAVVAGCILAIAATALLRKPAGYPLGWLTQIAAVAMGLLTPMMYAVGGFFALIWVASFVMGRRIEAKSAS